MPTEDIEDLIRELRDLQIRQNNIIERIAQARTRENTAVEDSAFQASLCGWSVGDKAYIINKVKLVRGKPISRYGTVTRITTENRDPEKTKIHVLTDDGHKTWRLAKNIRNLSKVKHEQHRR